ncbi:NAD(P)H-dependent FMN reductase [Labedella gwakjiensis]|uniref:NAD(P)H-dependent FMN reductase n=1 Tax=Labedella gwakjiensis TaxID=390269 RepID=A0A2P8GVE9_9MICO|nr:NAD(P)H-dependent oxidoreductase [Labedella gwakjiensis]PSL37944.1 NAD(P)H-dependent FMN reductase [Labedella gwakjiensis]RUQ87490.1 NADPH-dependent oxidoreductase [Labedella gwakjiensis]
MTGDRPTLLVVIATTRPIAAGRAVGAWVADRAGADDRFALDVVDLRDLALPFLDEPHHPKLRAYEHDHTHAWSSRVASADAFVFVTPEYNHSFTAPLKNALDYLNAEWAHKPVGLVSYGGLSGGSRAVTALEPVLSNLALLTVQANVEIAWVAEHIADDVFHATDRHDRALEAQLDAIARYLPVSAGLRSGG